MILLDASVLIKYLRHRNRELGRALGELELGICGITRAEVLHEARGDEDWRKLIVLMDQFQPVAMPEDLWDRVGRRLYELRTKGIVIPFQDTVLATLAMERDVELWSFDKHFPLIATVLPLRLYQSPEMDEPRD